jgi:uncharacterized protein (DUF1501 family)
MTDRRTILQGMLGASIAAVMPQCAFASVDTDARLVLVILRGALDGLAAVPAYGDGNYASQRGELAVSAGETKLDGMFALHPSLQNLHARHRARELVVFHALATPYRERSHFDGQDLLENGTTRPGVAKDGWLNRLLPVLPTTAGRETSQMALALAQNVPLVLRGSTQVNSWAPSRLPDADSDTLQRIADLYAPDPYFAGKLQAALASDAMAGEGTSGGGKRDPLNALGGVASAAGKFLAAPEGPRIAVLEAGGWDTHANQGAERGQLATRLRLLDGAIESLRTALGSAWQKTAVIVVTEFGRTVAVNGTRGTDHGTATCAFLVGGAVAGGCVVTDWPGLSTRSLYQARDLRPTTDARSVFKGVLAAHLGVSESKLEQDVFPASRDARPLEGLIKST